MLQTIASLTPAMRVVLLIIALLLHACWAGDPDIMALLLHLKFEPHHRNFVKNLYDKQMLVSRRPPRSPAIISRRWRHTG